MARDLSRSIRAKRLTEIMKYFQSSKKLNNDEILEVSCALCGKKYSGQRMRRVNIFQHIKIHHAHTDPPIIPESIRLPDNLEDILNSKMRFYNTVARPYFATHPSSKICCCFCKLCGDTITYRIDPAGSDRTTTDLMRHLQRKHKKDYSDCQKQIAEKNRAKRMSTSSVSNSISSTSASTHDVIVIDDDYDFSNNSSSKTIAHNSNCVIIGRSERMISTDIKRKETLDGLIMKMITSNLLPLSFVETKTFNDLAKTLNPDYQPPSPKDLYERVLPQVYDTVCQDVRLLLKLADKIAVTTEMWTLKNSCQFVTLTAHFSSLWGQRSLVLSTIKIKDNMTAQNLVEAIREVFSTWDIQKKVCVAVTENSLLLSDAMKILELEHIPCIAHFFKNSVDEALKCAPEFESIADKLRVIAFYFTYSDEATKMWTDLHGANTPLKLSQATDDRRWFQTLNLFRFYIEQHEMISTALCLLSKTDDGITESEVGFMKKTLCVLGPFESAVNELCDKHYSVSAVFPMASLLYDSLLDVQNQDFPIYNVLLEGLKDFNLSMNNCVTALASTALDHQFKDLTLTNFDHKVHEDTILLMLEQICDSATNLPSKPKSTTKVSSSSSHDNCLKKSLWGKFDSQVNEIADDATSSTPDPSIELKLYFEIQKPEVNSIGWWKSQETLFPNLSKLAQWFLAIPATAVPPVVIFQKESDVFRKLRSCLDEALIDKMIFLNKNYKDLFSIGPFLNFID